MTKTLFVYLGIVALFAGVFAIDYLTRLGLAEWVLYVLPIGLCLFQRHTFLPLAGALIATALIAIGFFISPQGISPELAAANRAIGVITIWFAAYFVRQTLITRENVLRLSWLIEGQGRIAQSALGEMKPEEVAHGLLSSLATYVGAQTAVLYRRDAGVLVRTAAYALAGAPEAPGHPAPG